LATATVTATFYLGSTFVAFNNQRYYDFFSENVPLGHTAIEYGENRNWDTLTGKKVVQSGKDAVNHLQRVISGTPHPQDTVEHTKDTASEKSRSEKMSAVEAYKESKARLKSLASTLKTDVRTGEERFLQEGAQATAIARHQAIQFSEGVEDLVRRAEAALVGKPFDVVQDATVTHSQSPPSASNPFLPQDNESTPLPPKGSTSEKIYDAPLPLGFEPPPGYTRAAPAKPEALLSPVKADDTTASLPLVAPAVSELSPSEPVIAHLASTIDNLASYLDSNPTATTKARDVLETAKADLTMLAGRIEQVRDEERNQLEQKLEEQTREYTTKLLELEMEARDKLDSQEDEFRKSFDEERSNVVETYRKKLDHELRTQIALINER
jgi:mitofilin